jgi:hypothetical protein
MWENLTAMSTHCTYGITAAGESRVPNCGQKCVTQNAVSTLLHLRDQVRVTISNRELVT